MQSSAEPVAPFAERPAPPSPGWSAVAWSAAGAAAFGLLGITPALPAWASTFGGAALIWAVLLFPAGLVLGARTAPVWAERRGDRPTLRAALVLALAGAALLAGAWDGFALAAGRLLTGVGLAGAAVVAGRLLPRPARRVRAGATVALVLFPLLGGLLQELVGWRWSPVIPVVAAALVGLVPKLPVEAGGPVGDEPVRAFRVLPVAGLVGVTSLVVAGVATVLPVYLAVARGRGDIGVGLVLTVLSTALVVGVAWGHHIRHWSGPAAPTAAGVLVAAAALLASVGPAIGLVVVVIALAALGIAAGVLVGDLAAEIPRAALLGWAGLGLTVGSGLAATTFLVRTTPLLPAALRDRWGELLHPAEESRAGVVTAVTHGTTSAVVQLAVAALVVAAVAWWEHAGPARTPAAPPVEPEPDDGPAEDPQVWSRPERVGSAVAGERPASRGEDGEAIGLQ